MDHNEYKKRLKCKFNTILNGQPEKKEGILSGFGVESSSDLSIDELLLAINALEGKVVEPQTYKPADRQTKWDQSKVLTLLTDMGVYYRDVEKGETKRDTWKRVDYVLQNICHAGRTLYEVEPSKLPALIRQLHKLKGEGRVWDRQQQKLVLRTQLSTSASPSAPISQPQPQKLAPKPVQISINFMAAAVSNDMLN